MFDSMYKTYTICAFRAKFRLLIGTNNNRPRGHSTTRTTLYIIQRPSKACRIFKGAHKSVVFRQGHRAAKEGTRNGSDE